MSSDAPAGGRRRAGAPAPHSIDEVLDAARQGVHRLTPEELLAAQAQGAHVIDIRSATTREPDGHIPGATVIERLVLEWRLDPGSVLRMAGGPEHDDLVVVVCNEGFYSSLAARDLRDLGFHRATDLVGGFGAYRDAGMPVQAEPSLIVA